MTLPSPARVYSHTSTTRVLSHTPTAFLTAATSEAPRSLLGSAGGLVKRAFRGASSVSRRIAAHIRDIDAALDSKAALGSGSDDHSASSIPIGEATASPLEDRRSAEIPISMGSFVKSRYALGMFIMAILLNRIQHIVVPSRTNPRLTPEERRRLPFWRSLYTTILPIDLSSTLSRTVLRIPSILFLLKVLGLWFIVFLQSSGHYPTLQWPWTQYLEEYTTQLTMTALCWSSFLAVCGALCVGALTSGLEGTRNSNVQPFNLFGFAFNMHIVSYGSKHISGAVQQPWRPDPSALFVLMVPILQLALIHLIGVKRSWSTHRLIPTAICSSMLLIHFHALIWTNPGRYPFMFSSYIMTGMESVLILATVIAMVLNALTQLLLEGAITRAFFGHSNFLMPRWDEDFHSALLRLGTASFEATSVAGLGNEVGSISLARSEPYGELEMNRAGVLSLTHAIDVTDHGRQTRRKEGFANEIRRIKVGQGSDLLMFWKLSGWRDTIKFGHAIFGALKNFVRIASRRISRGTLPSQPGLIQTILDPNAGKATTKRATVDIADAAIDLDQRVYQRFLSGENISDDESEFNPGTGHLSDDDDGDRSESSSELGSDDEAEAETLIANAISSAPAPLLLAHMSSHHGTVTRRRYGRISSNEAGAANNAWSDFVHERREAAIAQGPRTAGNDDRQYCVVCTVEQRRIICWPCRCLALCDDCRENLASRVASSRHFCPCCRQSVEGFSRIYVP